MNAYFLFFNTNVGWLSNRRWLSKISFYRPRWIKADENLRTKN